MLNKYLNEDWSWAILIFLFEKSCMEADGFLETTAYTFHDSGRDPITGKERSIPIYNQIDECKWTRDHKKKSCIFYYIEF